jgi:dTDP-4-amino-4,6-dideoxygalactose transaminase
MQPSTTPRGPTFKADSAKLAAQGGRPVFAQGPPGWPLHDEDIRLALERAYAQGDWGRYHGSQCAALAEELAAFHRVPHVMLCSSGTIAVELALRGLGVGPGDEVLLAGYDFAGNFRAVEACGARPVLVDVDPNNFNLDPSRLPQACSAATRAIVVSHLHGGVVPMRAVAELARGFRLRIVEDACQCPGAIIEGRVAGTWGDVGVLSFGGSKLMTAGRGGAVLTADAQIHQRIKIHCERGNHAFPLSELQAAVIRPQLTKLPQRNRIRLQNAQRLLQQVERIPGLQPLRNRVADTEPGYYKFGILCSPKLGSSLTRERFLEAAQAEGLSLDSGFRGFAGRGEGRCRSIGELALSQRAADNMMVLHHPVLLQQPETIDAVAHALWKVASALQ